MEAVGAFHDEEWEFLNRMFSTEEHDHNSFSLGSSSTFWPVSDDQATINMGPIDESFSQLVPNFHTFSPYNSVYFRTNPNLENQYLIDPYNFQETNYTLEAMHFNEIDNVENNASLSIFPNNDIEEILCEKEEEKGENSEHQPEIAAAEPSKELKLLKRKIDLSETPKKKSRVARDAQKGKKNVASEKNQKLSLNEKSEEGTNNGATNGQSCSSEEDSNASQEINGGGETSDSKSISALNSNGKTRAGRGAATDPQSLYARKRRERINERLRILQNLIPNGTKIDISTMLEEAVHYVKFMQLQIKLLSSDDLWMYAPIAYNGMDIGLYQNISPSL